MEIRRRITVPKITDKCRLFTAEMVPFYDYVRKRTANESVLIDLDIKAAESIYYTSHAMTMLMIFLTVWAILFVCSIVYFHFYLQ